MGNPKPRIFRAGGLTRVSQATSTLWSVRKMCISIFFPWNVSWNGVFVKNPNITWKCQIFRKTCNNNMVEFVNKSKNFCFHRIVATKILGYSHKNFENRIMFAISRALYFYKKCCIAEKCMIFKEMVFSQNWGFLRIQYTLWYLRDKKKIILAKKTILDFRQQMKELRNFYS